MSNGVPKRSLQEKVSITRFAVMGALSVLSIIELKEVVAPAFDELELVEAEANLNRAEKAIANDLENLSAIAGDWGAWDDAFDYVTGEYPAFEDSNLDRPTLTNLDLNLLVIYDARVDLIWGQASRGEADVSLEELEILNAGSAALGILTTHTDPGGQTNGLLNTGAGPMLISSWPITRSDSSRPIAGTLIMGQLLDDTRLARLRERTEVMLNWHEVDRDAQILSSLPVALNGNSAGTMLHESSDSEILSSGVLVDLFNAPVVLLEAATPRQISALGQSTVNGALLFLSLAALIVAVVAWMLLRSVIVLPLEGLAKHITGIRKSGDLTQRLNDTRAD